MAGGCEHPTMVMVKQRGVECTWECQTPGCVATRVTFDGRADTNDPTGLLLAIAHSVPAATRRRY